MKKKAALPTEDTDLTEEAEEGEIKTSQAETSGISDPSFAAADTTGKKQKSRILNGDMQEAQEDDYDGYEDADIPQMSQISSQKQKSRTGKSSAKQKRHPFRISTMRQQRSRKKQRGFLIRPPEIRNLPRRRLSMELKISSMRSAARKYRRKTISVSASETAETWRWKSPGGF